MAIISFGRTFRSRAVLGTVTGLLALLALGQTASAQIQKGSLSGGVRIAAGPPDLVVAVSAPAQIPQKGQMLVQVRVDNTLAPTPCGSTRCPLAGSTVQGTVLVRFTGLQPLTIQVDGTTGLKCELGPGGSAPSFVSCGGEIPANGTAIINIGVQESGNNCTVYCSPVYTDAIVDQGNAVAERSEANNRSLAVTDVINCIN